jgi:hypothetical protein
MGMMYWRIVGYNHDQRGWEVGDYYGDDDEISSEYAHKACQYLYRCSQTIPNETAAGAAGLMGVLFQGARFNATALYWYQVAEVQGAGTEEGAKAKAAKEDLLAYNLIHDIPLSESQRFPTRNTVGLVVNQ